MIRPLADWILVQVQPFEKKSSIIELPTNESSVRKATVVSFGPDVTKRVKGDIEAGSKVVYLRWHEEHRPGKAVSKILRERAGADEQHALIRLNDILFVYEGDINIDAGNIHI